MKVLMLVAILALLLMMPGPAPSAIPTRGEATGFFTSVQIFSSSRALSGGIGLGDVDRDGQKELVLSDFEGNVILLKEGEPGVFESEKIYTEPRNRGEPQGILDILVGDILLDKPGVEILAGGYSKNLTVIYWEGGEYRSKVLYKSPYQIFNIASGEFDQSWTGEEILLASFDIGTTDADADRMLRVLHREGSGFKIEEIELPDTPKALEVANIDPAISGNEIWVTTSGRTPGGGTESGLYEIKPDRSVTERYKDPEKLIANIKAGYFWSGNAGAELLAVDFGGFCRMIWEESGSYRSRIVFTATNPVGDPALLEGLSIDEFNPKHQGVEGLVTGYFNDVTQILEVEGEVISEMIWQTSMSDANLEIAGIAVGDYSALYGGNDIAIASRQGWVELIHYEEDGLSLWSDQGTVEMEDGLTSEFRIEVIPEGYSRGEVTFTVKGGEGLTFTFPDVTVDSHEPVFANLKVMSNFGDATTRIVPFTLSAAIGSVKTAPIELQAEVSSSGEIDLVPSSVTVYPEIVNERIVMMTLSGVGKVNLSVEAPSGIVVNAPSVLMEGQSVNVSLVAQKGPGTYPVSLKGMVGSRLAVESTLMVRVKSLSQDLDISMEEIGKNVYRVSFDYKGVKLDYPVKVDVFIGTDLMNTTSLTLNGPRKTTFEFTYRGDEDRDVNVTVSSSGEVGYWNIPGRVVKSTESSEFPTVILILFLVVMGLIAILVFLGLTMLRPRPGEDPGIERIGGPSRYHIGKEEPMRRGPMPRPRMAPRLIDRRGIPPRDRMQYSEGYRRPGPPTR